MVQWVKTLLSIAGGVGSIPGQEVKISQHALWPKTKAFNRTSIVTN